MNENNTKYQTSPNSRSFSCNINNRGSPDPSLGLTPMSLYGSPGVASTPEGSQPSPQQEWSLQQSSSPSVPVSVPLTSTSGNFSLFSPTGKPFSVPQTQVPQTAPVSQFQNFQDQIKPFGETSFAYSTQSMTLLPQSNAPDSWNYQSFKNTNTNSSNVSSSSQTLGEGSSLFPYSSSTLPSLEPTTIFTPQESNMLVDDFNTEHSLMLLEPSVQQLEEHDRNKDYFESITADLPAINFPRSPIQDSKKNTMDEQSKFIDPWAPEPDEGTSGSFSEWSASIQPLGLNLDNTTSNQDTTLHGSSMAIPIPTNRLECPDNERFMTRKRSVSRSPLGGLIEGSPLSPVSPTSPEYGTGFRRRSSRLKNSDTLKNISKSIASQEEASSREQWAGLIGHTRVWPTHSQNSLADMEETTPSSACDQDHSSHTNNTTLSPRVSSQNTSPRASPQTNSGEDSPVRVLLPSGKCDVSV